MLNVQIALFDGFDLLDAIAPYEVFCAANMYVDGELNVELVTAEGPRAVSSGVGGLKLEASGTLNPDRKGIILVPGASGEVEGDGPDSVPALLARAMNTQLTVKLKHALERPGNIVATVCGGSLVLAMGGLLEGRPTVTNHLGMDLLGATGARPIHARVVDDGNLVTGGGITSGLDVALYLVERELGPRIAHAVEELFEYERRGTVWRNSGIPPRHKSVVEDAGTVSNPAALHDANMDGNVQKATFDGEWDTIIATPVGKLEVKLDIRMVDGVILGKATQGDEVSAFIHPVLKGHTLCWSQRISKPMRLNLNFEVTVEGDLISGIVKAGILPASKLSGKRIRRWDS